MRLLLLQLLVLFCSLVVPWTSQSQPVSLLNYSIREGLPSNEVYDIFQDKEGFMWFATDNGVVRFDGEEMKLFHVKDGLSDPVTFGFHEDYAGRLWFRTFSGKISYYDHSLNKIFPYKYSNLIEKFISNGGILNSLFVDSTATWISTNYKQGQIDSLGNLKTQELPPQTFSLNEIKNHFLLGFNPKDMIIDKVIINQKSFPVSLTKTPLANHVVSAIHVKDELFFSVITDMFKYKDGKVTKVFTAPLPIINLSKDNDNNIWIGTINSGVVKMNYQTKAVSQNDFLTDKSITRTYQDRDGNFWFSTLENGIYFLPTPDIKILPTVTNSKIKAVTVYNNKVVVGDQNGFIRFMDNRTPVNIKSPVISFFTDFKNRLWVSTNSEILIFNEDFQLQRKLNHVTKIGFSSDGKSIWGTGSISSKFSLDGEITDTYHSGVYRSILVKDSLILLSGRLGFEVRSKDFELYQKPKELEPYKITSIVSLSDKIDLLTTMGNGFILLENFKVMSKFNTQNNFIADNIYSAIKKDTLLFMGTEKGLISITIPSLLKGDISAHYLSRKTGLFENKINFLAATEEILWAFSENGISLIPFSEIISSRSSPKFYLKSIIINNNETKSLAENLSYNQNNIEIRYGFLSFNSSELFVRFRLSETDPWTYTQERALRFFSLNPGSYSLQIEFSANNNTWTRAPQNLNFTITPPWWTIWYVQLLIGIVILTTILIYFQLQLKFSKQKQVHLKILADHQQQLMNLELESVEKERNRIAKDLHDGVGTSLLTLKMMVGHTIHLPSDKELIEERFQDTFSELKNVILDLSPPGLDRYGLLTGIQVYVDKIKHTLPAKIELYTFGEEINDTKVSPLLFRIIQELLSNSIKHSNANLIKIQINSFKDLISIIFEDNGQGFDINQKQGVGLGSIKFRIESLNGTYNIQSSSNGSSFVIDIPFNGS